MKRKIFSVLFALVLVLSFSLIMAAPAAASAVGTPTVTLSSYLTGAADVQHTISFDIGVGMVANDDIIITFAAAYDTPLTATWEDGDITVDGESVPSAKVSTSTDEVTITLRGPILTADNPVVVVFTSAANIINPAAATYTLTVSTTVETVATSASYTIYASPTVSGVEPASGNVDETMWVEVKGTNFTGTASTNECTTTIAFGDGASVVAGSYRYIGTGEIDLQILINTTGTLTVSATTLAGTGATTAPFTASAYKTKQVDLWDAYDLTADPFVTGSLTWAATKTGASAITEALTTASDGDTIIIHAGTYTEDALQPGSDETIIIQSLTGLKTGTGSAADTIITASDLATGSGEFMLAVALPGSGADTLTVKGLTITSTTTFDTAALEYPGVGVRIHSNAYAASILTITNCVISNFVWGVATELAGTTVSVTNSTISSCNHGIALFQAADLTLTGSTITDHLACGVLLEDSIDFTGKSILIYKNTFQDNNSTLVAGGDPLCPAGAITFAAGASMSPTWSVTNAISYNNFINNGYAIENTGGAAVPARYNWWGDISGPSCGDPTSATKSTALGSGDAILDEDTVYEPWLTETYANVYVDNIRYYGALYPLEAGWNTLSVPLALKGTADSLTEIVGLGDYIVSSGTSQNWLSGYYYDASLGLWQPLTGAYEFAPGKAVYIKMKATAEFPILYSGQIGLPTVSLSKGWNLIGSAFGIDKVAGGADLSLGDYGICSLDPTGGTTYGGDEVNTTDADDESWKAVDDALASLGANASVVISPGVPGQELTWGDVATSATNYMIVGEGYWVYIEAEAGDTLVGFEVTPMYFVFP